MCFDQERFMTIDRNYLPENDHMFLYERSRGFSYQRMTIFFYMNGQGLIYQRMTICFYMNGHGFSYQRMTICFYMNGQGFIYQQTRVKILQTQFPHTAFEVYWITMGGKVGICTFLTGNNWNQVFSTIPNIARPFRKDLSSDNNKQKRCMFRSTWLFILK